MEFPPPSMRLHLRALTRSAYHIHIPRIPPTRSIAVSTPLSRVVPSFPAPPARRRLEPAPPPTNPPPPTPRRHDRRPTNHHIPFDHVFLVDPVTNTLSRTKHPLSELLATRGRNVIELLASTPEPIVRITTRAEVEARYREIRRAARRGAKAGEEPKEVQLTWGVGKADLEHKLRKAGRDLDKGYRVVVVVSTKHRHRPSNRQELVAFADEISGMLSEVGEEWKEREFSGRLMVLSFRKTEQDDDVP